MHQGAELLLLADAIESVRQRFSKREPHICAAHYSGPMSSSSGAAMTVWFLVEDDATLTMRVRRELQIVLQDALRLALFEDGAVILAERVQVEVSSLAGHNLDECMTRLPAATDENNENSDGRSIRHSR